MVKKDIKGRVSNLKTLRLLVEIVEGENGFSYITRTENGVPIASSSCRSAFINDLRTISEDFENFNPAAHGNEEN